MIKSAFQYHKQTSYERGRMGGHYLDWPNQPDVFKEYQTVTPIPLPDETPSLKKSLSYILRETDIDPTCQRIDINDLSLILRLTYTITARSRYGSGEFYYRSAASAGALYPTEIYIGTSGINGLDNGLYHYAIHRNSLFPLRTGSFADYIRGFTFDSAGRLPGLTFIFTAIFFRSSWKYRDRAYRYHLLDTGHVIENMNLSLKALKFQFNISYDFDDKGINHLLGLDEKKEAAMAIIHVPGPDSASELKKPEIDGLSEDMLKASIVSKKEIDYPAIQEIHRAGYETKGDLEPDIPESSALIPETWHNLDGSLSNIQEIKYPECLFKRRSRRNFVNAAIEKNILFSLLDSLCVNERNKADKRLQYHLLTLTTGFLTGNIESTDQGFYVLDTLKKRFGMVTAGNFINSMTRACLDQEWLKNCGVHFLFISDLTRLDRTHGPRGYRYAMMTAGRLGQRIYIASTALNLGCCGIGAFYDKEAADLLGLNRDSRLLYLVAVGKVKR